MKNCQLMCFKNSVIWNFKFMSMEKEHVLLKQSQQKVVSTTASSTQSTREAMAQFTNPTTTITGPSLWRPRFLVVKEWVNWDDGNEKAESSKVTKQWVMENMDSLVQQMQNQGLDVINKE